MLGNGSRVRSNEKLDRVGRVVVAQERLAPGAVETVDAVAFRDGEGFGDGLHQVSFGDRLALRGFLVGPVKEFDVDKVHFHLLGGFDTDKKGGTTAGKDELLRVVDGLEDESRGTFL